METYTAHHSDTLEDILGWPWRRFEELYDAYMRRALVERLERRKEMMVAALWANSGFEGQEGSDARSNAITELEEQFEDVATQILSGVPEQEEEIPEENQFFAAAKKGMAKIDTPRNDEGSVGAALKGEYDGLRIDQ